MRVSIDLRPTVFKAISKTAIDSRVAQMGTHFVVGGNSIDRTSYYARRVSGRRGGADGDFVLVNYEKHRAKFKNNPNGGKKIKVSDGYWIGYIYRVPARLVKQAHQKSRNFTLTVG